MPEHLRALIVILVLASVVFMFAKRPICITATSQEDFERRRNLWFGITLIAFLAHNFWIYVLFVAALLLLNAEKELNKLSLYYFLLFAVPPITSEISGFGGIRSFFTIDYLRLLSLVILFPAALKIWQKPDTVRFGRLLPDKLLIGYISLFFILTLIASSITHALRSGFFYALIDIFLPYYVASRCLSKLKDFRDALISYVAAVLVVSAISAFEFTKHWLLYAGLDNALGVNWAYGAYLERGDGTLRAQASAGHAIPLGYTIAVALGFFLYVKQSIPSKKHRILLLLALICGAIAPMSRGPWVGAAGMFLIFFLLSEHPMRNLFRVGAFVSILLPLLLVLPGGERILDFLPFIGTVDEENVTYRQRLLEISISVILQNPFFGAFDYLFSAEMQELRQGQGIIDIVNTFVAVALSGGFVGLSLFSGFFIVVAISVFKALRRLHTKKDENYLLGQALLSTLFGVMVIITTTSSITVIPVIYWSLAGMCVAYARMIAIDQSTKNFID